MSLSGIITALATPFGRDGSLDLNAWTQLLTQQLSARIDGVVVGGSTGEAAMLSDDESQRLLCAAVSFVAGRIPVIAGTGLSGTAKTIANTQRAAAAGADYALVVTPPYLRPTQAGLVAHFVAVASEGDLPIVIYNVTGRTGSDLLPETVAQLATHPNIVAIKESNPSSERMRALLALRSDDFHLLSGDDLSAIVALLLGFDGVVSVASNVVPAAQRRLYEAASCAQSPALARSWADRLADLHVFCGIEPNPIPIKALLQRLGIGQDLRLPLTPLSQAHHGLADQFIHSIRLLEAKAAHSNQPA